MPIRLPVHIVEKTHTLKKAERELEQTLGRVPTMGELSDVLHNDGMKIALEVIEALHSTHPDHIREDYLDEAKHGAFTPQQTREYYREKLEEK